MKMFIFSFKFSCEGLVFWRFELTIGCIGLWVTGRGRCVYRWQAIAWANFDKVLMHWYLMTPYGIIEIGWHLWSYDISRLKLVHTSRPKDAYHQTSNISCTKSQNSNVSRLVSQLPLPNPLKPGVKSRMKIVYWGLMVYMYQCFWSSLVQAMAWHKTTTWNYVDVLQSSGSGLCHVLYCWWALKDRLQKNCNINTTACTKMPAIFHLCCCIEFRVKVRNMRHVMKNTADLTL